MSNFYLCDMCHHRYGTDGGPCSKPVFPIAAVDLGHIYVYVDSSDYHFFNPNVACPDFKLRKEVE